MWGRPVSNFSRFIMPKPIWVCMYLRKALLKEILHQSHFWCFQTSFLQSLGTEKQLSSCYRSILPDLTAQLKDGEKTPLNLYPSVCLQCRTVDTGNSHTGACRTATERLAFHSRLQFINDWKQNGLNILARFPKFLPFFSCHPATPITAVSQPFHTQVSERLFSLHFPFSSDAAKMVCIAVDTVSALEVSRPCRNSGKPGKWYRQIMQQLLSPPLRAAPSAAGLEVSSSSVQDLLLCSVYTKQGVTTELIVPSLWFTEDLAPD